jgi:glycosyltransferase involved in cell wall biosynthesis
MLHAPGIGTYLRNLVPLVIDACPDIKFNLLGNIKELRQFKWAERDNIMLIDCQSPIYSIAEQFKVLRKIPKSTTLFWSPHYNIPILYGGKMLVTVYDVFHLAMPELVGGLHKRLYAKAVFKAVRQKAAAIITISNFTKEEFIRLVGKGRQEIYPIYIGVAESWFNIEKNNNPHDKPYLLYVGSVKPHKNLANLVEAFGSIIGKIQHDLVIAGRKDGFITADKKVESEAAKLGNRVHFTGYVNDEILRQYFIHAAALVFPSMYEGFGLPPLEAMACGCPVIVSNAASLPEVCGDGALYCNPYSPQDIADKIWLVLNDTALVETLRQKGLERAKKFTWGKCALETCKVINELL